MFDQKVKSVRALERGLDVLQAIRRSRGMSLNELHKGLGLPKATLLRMLVTLASRGMIWQRLADAAYLPSANASAIGANFHAINSVAEIASPYLAQLSDQVLWPSVIAVPRLDHVEIIETNSPLIRLDSAILGPVGAKLSYIHTATGRAYLAACDVEEREAILGRLRSPEVGTDAIAGLESIIREIKQRGYSSRDPRLDWSDRGRIVGRLAARSDGRRSIAVAVKAGGLAVASINITWPLRRATQEQIVERHLGALQRVATQIGEAIEMVSH